MYVDFFSFHLKEYYLGFAFCITSSKNDLFWLVKLKKKKKEEEDEKEEEIVTLFLNFFNASSLYNNFLVIKVTQFNLFSSMY
jgi:hypothetical protein